MLSFPCRDMAARYGIKYFYDITDRSDFRANPDYKGVCHIAMAQEGHCKPGALPRWPWHWPSALAQPCFGPNRQPTQTTRGSRRRSGLASRLHSALNQVGKAVSARWTSTESRRSFWSSGDARLGPAAWSCHWHGPQMRSASSTTNDTPEGCH